jgi:uncharacterized low-complexity protein
MAIKNTRRAFAAALGSTIVATLAASPIASAAGNPFTMKPLASGYQVAESSGTKEATEAHCGAKGKDGKELHCGAKTKGKDGQCGEAKCGGNRR